MLLVILLSFLYAKLLLMKIFFESANKWNSIVGIDASQVYPYSTYQPIPTGPYTRWDLDPETSRNSPSQKKTRGFENIVMSSVQRTETRLQNWELLNTRQTEESLLLECWLF